MALIPLEERKIVPELVDFVPSAYPSQNPTLAWPVSELVQDLEKDARDAGFEAPQFQIISGLRDYNSQKKLWEQALKDANGNVALARKTTAPPGKSSHFSGFAFDIFLGRGGTLMSRAPSQFKSKEYKFMRDVLGPKYQLTQLSNEPWHWECDQNCRESYLLNKYGNSNYTPPSDEIARMRSISEQNTSAFASAESSSNSRSYLLIGCAVGLAAFGVWALRYSSKK